MVLLSAVAFLCCCHSFVVLAPKDSLHRELLVFTQTAKGNSRPQHSTDFIFIKLFINSFIFDIISRPPCFASSLLEGLLFPVYWNIIFFLCLFAYSLEWNNVISLWGFMGSKNSTHNFSLSPLGTKFFVSCIVTFYEWVSNESWWRNKLFWKFWVYGVLKYLEFMGNWWAFARVNLFWLYVEYTLISL